MITTLRGRNYNDGRDALHCCQAAMQDELSSLQSFDAV